MPNNVPYWGEFQPMIDAAMKEDPYLNVLLFMQSVRVSGKTGVDIAEAAVRIKGAMLEMLQLFDAPYPYSDVQLVTMVTNIKAAEPKSEIARSEISPAMA